MGKGRRHAELEPAEVAHVLDAMSTLGFTSPLLRVALEHALLRVTTSLEPADCTRALRGALDVGMGVRSAAVRSLLRRCTTELGLIPPEDVATLRDLGMTVRQTAEEEVVAAATSTSRSPIA